MIPNRWREQIYRGLLANDIIGFHLPSYVHNFLDCCRELMGFEVDYEHDVVRHDGKETWCRAYPLGVDSERLRRVADSNAIVNYERELLFRRREHLIIRVDRADLSKNVLRGFTAFDQFLSDHPEFHERVTFIAHLQPSRQDVPEYQEYLERIEALVAVVNHRHGTTDWMPIDLRIYENFHEAVARYKHFDLLMVNALFDGMNLVAKEAPAVNTRDGVLMLSENTGAHVELGECRAHRQPVRHRRAGRGDPPGADDGPGGAPPSRRSPARDHRRDRSRRPGSTASSPTSRPSAPASPRSPPAPPTADGSGEGRRRARRSGPELPVGGWGTAASRPAASAGRRRARCGRRGGDGLRGRLGRWGGRARGRGGRGRDRAGGRGGHRRRRLRVVRSAPRDSRAVPGGFEAPHHPRGRRRPVLRGPAAGGSGAARGIRPARSRPPARACAGAGRPMSGASGAGSGARQHRPREHGEQAEAGEQRQRPEAPRAS